MVLKLPVSSCEKFYSHPGISLEDHLREVGILCRKYVADVRVKDPRIIEASELIGKCHDLAKYTPFFQRHLFGERVHGDLSTHSKLSAIFTSWLLGNRFRDPFLAATGFLCVDSHHGNLKSFDFLSQFDGSSLGDHVVLKQVESIRNRINVISSELEELGLQDVSDFIHEFEERLPEVGQLLKRGAHSLWFKSGGQDGWSNYYITLLLYSSLVDADKKDAGKALKEIASHPKSLTTDIVPLYMRRKFHDASEINRIRRSIFWTVDSHLTKTLSEGGIPKILTITAPTGCGKTLLGLHVALKLRGSLQERQRIVYCLPYINIIEQTHSSFEEVLSTHHGEKPDLSMLLKHHHLAFPERKLGSKEVALDKLLLLADSWESEIIVTTFEQLLKSMLGCRNSLLKKFHNLANSILILDEVQAIPLEYWKLIRDALSCLAEHFDMKIILMTATMPAIFRGQSFELLPKPEIYFKRMERIKLYPELERTVNAEQFADFFLSKWTMGNSALLILNTVKTSKNVYERIAQRLTKNVVRLGSEKYAEVADFSKAVLAYLSTSIIPKERKRRIDLLKSLLKEHRSVILVSTQVVEAGVDLDFDMVFRDLGPLDSIVQAAGRCNRNWKTAMGQVYVLRVSDDKGVEDSKKIYGKILPERTIQFIANMKCISEKELPDIVESYYKDVFYRMNVEKHPEYIEWLARIKALDFQGLAKFSLIKEEPKVSVYIEYDEDAKHTLKEFRRLVKEWEKVLSNLDEIFKHKANIRKARSEMENYTVEVYQNEPSLKGLELVMDGFDVLVVSYEALDAYYDTETGFKSAKDQEADFLII
jgi:CRISPR-associated endonuclease/helicase Cas3